MTTFRELGLSEPLLEDLAHLGYEQPTPIQEQAIPALLAGRDVIGQAQTGTGKTAAFGLPLLEYIDLGQIEVQALVITPTRELCIQVTQALRAYGKRRGVEVVACFGGAPIRTQMAQLKEAQVVVGTPGRVMDLISRHALFLGDARYVVLDEADEMLDLGFIEDMEYILGKAPRGRQTALFSATMPPEIRKLADQFMLDPEVIKVKAPTLTVDTVEQYFVVVDEREKAGKLAELLRSEKPTQAIVFARTKIGVDRLTRQLSDKGLRVKALHGDMSQGSRDGVMIAFKAGREPVLVATDVAARGLDISTVSHVVNYDPPNSPDVYVHRIGRTGRVGRNGRAITLVTPKQRKDIDAIERHAKTKMMEWGSATPGVTQKPRVAPAEDAAPAGDAPAGDAAAAPGPPEAEAPAQQAPEPEEREVRRPRHTKPRQRDGRRAKLIIASGRAHGTEPSDIVESIVDATHLDNDDIHNVRVLERFSFAEVPESRAGEVAEKVKFKAEVAKK